MKDNEIKLETIGFTIFIRSLENQVPKNVWTFCLPGDSIFKIMVKNDLCYSTCIKSDTGDVGIAVFQHIGRIVKPQSVYIVCRCCIKMFFK